MAQLIDIQRVEIGPENLTARVRLAPEAPLMTSENLEATTRVYRLLPHIIEHTCMGDYGETFKDCMGDTELAHLLEHVAVELLAQTDIAGDITSGKTYQVAGDDRTFDIQVSCNDDVLTVAALSSAAWILDWAFGEAGEPKPDVAGIVAGLVDFVGSLGTGAAEEYEREVQEEIDHEVEAERSRLMRERDERRAIERARAEAAARAEAEVRMRAEEERLAEEARLAAEREAQERAAAEAAAAAEAERLAAEEAARQEAERIEAEVDAVLAGDDIIPFDRAPEESGEQPTDTMQTEDSEPSVACEPEPDMSAYRAYEGRAVTPEALKAIEELLGVPVRFVYYDNAGEAVLSIEDEVATELVAEDEAVVTESEPVAEQESEYAEPGDGIGAEDEVASAEDAGDDFDPAAYGEVDAEGEFVDGEPYAPSQYGPSDEPPTFGERIRSMFDRLFGRDKVLDEPVDGTTTFDALPEDVAEQATELESEPEAEVESGVEPELEATLAEDELTEDEFAATDEAASLEEDAPLAFDESTEDDTPEVETAAEDEPAGQSVTELDDEAYADEVADDADEYEGASEEDEPANAVEPEAVESEVDFEADDEACVDSEDAMGEEAADDEPSVDPEDEEQEIDSEDVAEAEAEVRADAELGSEDEAGQEGDVLLAPEEDAASEEPAADQSGDADDFFFASIPASRRVR